MIDGEICRDQALNIPARGVKNPATPSEQQHIGCEGY
jgi:hypothetical protein